MGIKSRTRSSVCSLIRDFWHQAASYAYYAGSMYQNCQIMSIQMASIGDYIRMVPTTDVKDSSILSFQT